MEEVLIAAIVFGFSFAVLYMIFDYLKSRGKSKSSSAPADSSLTTSELQRLVREAVEDAMDDRFGQFEKRLERFSEPRLIPAGKSESKEMDHPASPPVAGDRETTR